VIGHLVHKEPVPHPRGYVLEEIEEGNQGTRGYLGTSVNAVKTKEMVFCFICAEQ